MLEIVSKTPGDEYTGKLRQCAQLGIRYYTVYNPDHWQRDGHDPFEVYQLDQGSYRRRSGNPVWMPEIGLGIGIARGTHEGLVREWLYWYDEHGNRYPAPENAIASERKRVERAEQQVTQERLRQQGINPDNL